MRKRCVCPYRTMWSRHVKVFNFSSTSRSWLIRSRVGSCTHIIPTMKELTAASQKFTLKWWKHKDKTNKHGVPVLRCVSRRVYQKWLACLSQQNFLGSVIEHHPKGGKQGFSLDPFWTEICLSSLEVLEHNWNTHLDEPKFIDAIHREDGMKAALQKSQQSVVLNMRTHVKARNEIDASMLNWKN